ncbi:MAG TPA: tetratricopeptide repeat protein [Limnobacter sp.]|nr:tetratricopeptide repeat protein [Limnobacter sp.]
MSFGKDALGLTVQTCRLELTGTAQDARRVRILETLGKAYLAQNEIEAAISTWNEASQYTAPSRDDLKASESWARLQVLIGQTYAQSTEVDKAENQFKKTLEKVETVSGRYSLPAGLVQDAMGAFYSLQNKPAEAETAFRRARIVYELRLGKTSLKTLESRMNQAVGLLDMGKEQEALSQFQILADVMNPLEQFKNEPVRAEVLTFLGTLQMRNDLLQQASSNYKAAFEIRQNVYGPRDIRTSQSLNNLGVVLYRAGQLEAAEAALGKAYVIRADSLGATDPLTISTQKNLQAVIAAQNKAKAQQAAR